MNLGLNISAPSAPSCTRRLSDYYKELETEALALAQAARDISPTKERNGMSVRI